MRPLLAAVLIVAVLLAAGPGCGRKSRERKLEEAAQQMQKLSEKMEAGGKASMKDVATAAAAMQKAMSAASTNAQLADFRELKALLPEELPGLKRSDISGEKSGAFGMNVAKASATYENDADARIEIEITDLGGMPGVGTMAQFGWMAAEVDRETGNGYERTTTIAGHKGLEKYDKQDRSGNIQVMVKGRFMVEVRGNGVDADAIRAAVGKIPLDKLAGL
jgi:hypothetical protein